MNKKDSVQPWNPVTFVNIPIKTTSRIKAFSQQTKSFSE